MGYQMGYDLGLQDGRISIEEQAENYVRALVPIRPEIKAESAMWWTCEGAGIVKGGYSPQEAAELWLDSLTTRDWLTEEERKELLTEAEASKN